MTPKTTDITKQCKRDNVLLIDGGTISLNFLKDYQTQFVVEQLLILSQNPLNTELCGEGFIIKLTCKSSRFIFFNNFLKFV